MFIIYQVIYKLDYYEILVLKYNGVLLYFMKIVMKYYYYYEYMQSIDNVLNR